MGKSKAKRVLGPRPKHPIKTAATKTGAQEKPRVSKKDSVIALLRRPEGATLKVMMKATGWQSHSVRGFLAGTVGKKMKLKLQSEKTGGERIYRLAGAQKIGTGRAGKSALCANLRSYPDVRGSEKIRDKKPPNWGTFPPLGAVEPDD